MLRGNPRRVCLISRRFLLGPKTHPDRLDRHCFVFPTDLALGYVTAEVVFRSVGMQRNFRSLEDHEQLGLVSMEAFEQAIEGDEAGLPREEAIKPCRQRQLAPLAGGQSVGFEIAVETPD